MAGYIHLVKLCVGADGVEDLAAWQATGAARAPCGRPMHVTRMWPRRAGELLAGGSLYWVFRGAILARQRLAGLERLRGADGVMRCGLVLEPAIQRTETAPRRPFQGWRYLAPEEAPSDLNAGDLNAGDLNAGEPVSGGRADRHGAVPPALLAALAELGVR